MTPDPSYTGAAPGPHPGGNQSEESRDAGRGGPRKRAPRRFHRRKVCRFCIAKAEYIDYKDARRLGRYVSDRGKMLPRRVTGCCAGHQRMLTMAIKRARNIALLPFKAE
jgi:small subunit ribosomal protein S18